MPRSTLRKGQYLICKYRGENGDLILGQITSVRSIGEVLIRDLLNDRVTPSVKKIEIVASRNIVCPKKVADSLVREYQQHKIAHGEADAKRHVRALVVTHAKQMGKEVPEQMKLDLEEKPKTKSAVTEAELAAIRQDARVVKTSLKSKKGKGIIATEFVQMAGYAANTLIDLNELLGLPEEATRMAEEIAAKIQKLSGIIGMWKQ